MSKGNNEDQKNTLPPIGSDELDARGAESAPVSTEQALREEVNDLRGKLASVLNMVQQISSKTGTKVKLGNGETVDGEAQISRDYNKEVIVDHEMLQGSRVEQVERGKFVDLQFVKYTTQSGKTEEVPYNVYQQMLKNNRIPVKIEGYIQNNPLDGRNYVAPKFQGLGMNDDIEVVLGKYTAQGTREYGNERVTVKFKMINAQ